LLVNSNPVEQRGAPQDVRVLDQVCASVRARAGKFACDWKFKGIVGDASQQRRTQEQHQQQGIAPVSIGSASAVGDRADERRGAEMERERGFAANEMAALVSVNAQYDLMPREVGGMFLTQCPALFAAHKANQVRARRGVQEVVEGGAACVGLMRQLKAGGNEGLCRLHLVLSCAANLDICSRVNAGGQVVHLWMQAMGVKHALPSAAIPTMVRGCLRRE
jgi:hypothetical protein